MIEGLFVLMNLLMNSLVKTMPRNEFLMDMIIKRRQRNFKAFDLTRWMHMCQSYVVHITVDWLNLFSYVLFTIQVAWYPGIKFMVVLDRV